MINKKSISKKVALVAMVGAAWCASSNATEPGVGSVYPNGTENYMAGALPPPGLYGMVFATQYNATKLKDNSGNDVAPGVFSLKANVVAGRIAWVPGIKALGGDLVAHAIVPVVDLKVTAPNGVSGSKSGIGDITTGVGVGYHHSPNLHSVVAFDFFLPTGEYDKNSVANVGRNHLAYEPVYAISYIDPTGFNGDVKMGYIMNKRNTATDFKSGDEFHFDYAAGWGVGNGWTVGVGGYYLNQVSDDKAGSNYAGPPSTGKAHAFAIGPSVKYDSGKGWFATLKYQQESSVRNAAQGNQLWLKTVFPL